ncbi:PAS domain S-box-containing protein [Vibrio xiamenensis]|uniref:PAS domain S-box-containing protein n=1 Tax=Vibrio xiamenensis TaxID=861298 RepID=A0A1G8AT41_9VIBR|nr:EAL domain-containing protein [Vibrio xiamenensis]SDH24107.1 PAS domain S-box-containing protein [Vibrio xiamenensis]
MNDKSHRQLANTEYDSQGEFTVKGVSQLEGFPLSGAELDLFMDNHFKHLFDVFSDGIFYMADSSQMFYYNPSFYAQFGIQPGHTSFSAWLDLVHPEDRLLLQRRVALHANMEGKRLSTEYRVRRTDGQYIWVQGTAITKTIDGEVFLVGCHRDISDKKTMESYIHRAAFIDTESGLSNTNKLHIDIDDITATQSGDYSLLYVQIDDVKSYLNIYGQQILQNLLNHLITTLNQFPDHFVDVYRVHSDDFAILVKGYYDPQDIQKLGERILQSYRKAIDLDGHLYGKDMNIGIYPNFDKSLSATELVKIAARTCKFAGENNFTNIGIYIDSTKNKVDRHFYIEQQLKKAINEQQLTVKFQPIVSASTNQIASFEALVRWRSKEWGEIYPDEFIAVAEKKGFIVDLGYLVFEKACHFIKEYQKLHQRLVRVNINVSVLQILNNHFPEQVRMLAEREGVDTDNIVLELTETIIIDGNKKAIRQLIKLNEYGFRLSLDDFGSGYSSLHSFFDLPLSQIKVDKNLAWKSLTNPATYEYLRFITDLCRSYNVDIVIEGIENADMHHKFSQMGVAFLQGYWYSKPLSLASASHYTEI